MEEDRTTTKKCGAAPKWSNYSAAFEFRYKSIHLNYMMCSRMYGAALHISRSNKKIIIMKCD